MPRIRHLVVLLAALLFAGALAQEGQAAEEGPFDFLTLELVADGFVSPVTLTAPADDDRLFVVDRTGQVYVVSQDGTRSETPFLDIADRMVQLDPGYDERGLLGFAFHRTSLPTAARSRTTARRYAPARPKAGTTRRTSPSSPSTRTAPP